MKFCIPTKCTQNSLSNYITIFILDTNKILGVGAFGTVFEGSITGNGEKSVAFKTLKVGNRVTMKAILAEIKIMSYIGFHPHVVQLLGAYTAEAVKGTL